MWGEQKWRTEKEKVRPPLRWWMFMEGVPCPQPHANRKKKEEERKKQKEGKAPFWPRRDQGLSAIGHNCGTLGGLSPEGCHHQPVTSPQGTPLIPPQMQ